MGHNIFDFTHPSDREEIRSNLQLMSGVCVCVCVCGGGIKSVIFCRFKLYSSVNCLFFRGSLVQCHEDLRPEDKKHSDPERKKHQPQISDVEGCWETATKHFPLISLFLRLLMVFIVWFLNKTVLPYRFCTVRVEWGCVQLPPRGPACCSPANLCPCLTHSSAHTPSPASTAWTWGSRTVTRGDSHECSHGHIYTI